MTKRLDYDKLLYNASISVVKEILHNISDNGFYKKQHLYITFSLNHPDTNASKTLRDEFEDELTILLQYEFWDLKIDNYGFSVGLAFEHADEILYIPYSSLICISDPSENFNLDFTPNLEDRIQKTNPVINNNNNKIQPGKVISLDAFRKGK